MKAMILAAGLGTRLRPWTLCHPKALVPVGGVPMLQRVLFRLAEEGFDSMVVNVHHFADQITDFIDSPTIRNFLSERKIEISVSDESDHLMDTGGALVKALPLLEDDSDSPFLVHNVDILSDANLRGLLNENIKTGADSTLLVSSRDSSRQLVFDESMLLRGWHNVKEECWRPECFRPSPGMCEYAFSGIYAIRPSAVRDMERCGLSGKFGVMDYFLSPHRNSNVRGLVCEDLHLIDIGKPATLSQADSLFV